MPFDRRPVRESQVERTCNICGFVGLFGPFGYNLRRDAKCQRCGSLERHRLLKLWFDRCGASLLARSRVLHFAPEESVRSFVAPLCGAYFASDLIRNRVAIRLNIEKIALKDESIDAVICFHVLEHVDDKKALNELRRVLTRGGIAILSVPIVEGWEFTYENNEVSSPNDRLLHFGQEGHLRRYGRDFRARIKEAGLEVEEFVADGQECASHSLLPGERIFIGTKLGTREEAGHLHVSFDVPCDGRRILCDRAGDELAVTASAPGRVDISGRLDIPEYFFQFYGGSVGTSNIAISLRTCVTFVSSSESYILFQSEGVEEKGFPYRDPTQSSVPYFWSAVRHFGGRSGTYRVAADMPMGSGLGGSSAFLIALLAVIFVANGVPLASFAEKSRLAMIAYYFENSLGFSSVGFQDYLASVFGYANFWSWGASLNHTMPFARKSPICSPGGVDCYKGNILWAYSGEPHLSNRIDGIGIAKLSEGERDRWLRVGRLAESFAFSMRERNWNDVASIMKEERDLWLELTGQSMSRRVKALIDSAEATGVGARFAGVATGGSVWAIGASEDIARLGSLWRSLSIYWPTARVMAVQIDSGLELLTNEKPQPPRSWVSQSEIEKRSWDT